MKDVQILLNRVVKEIESRGYELTFINYSLGGSRQLKEKAIDVHETYRYNHSDKDNITVTIEVTTWNLNNLCGKRLFKLKVPANASDKVISNRVDKVIEFYNNL